MFVAILMGSLAGVAGVTPSHDMQFVVWDADPVQCDGQAVLGAHMESPLPEPANPFGTQDKPMRLEFRVDAAGRPLGIKARPKSATQDNDLFEFGNRDLQPSLAASRLPAGHPTSNCSVTYTPRQIKIDPSHRDIIVEYLMSADRPQPLGNSREVMDVISPGSHCSEPPIPRVVYFPALDLLPKLPGHVVNVVVGFDLDANGVPTAATILHNSGDAEAGRQSVEALLKSRFAAEARKGCVVSQRERAADLPAPPAVRLTDYVTKDANCPVPGSSILHVADVPFPEEFRRRSIEGWALVRFDVAPWGEVGNASPILAEPAEGFGASAASVVMAANADKSPSGYSGCVAKIVFKLDQERPEGVSGGKP